MASPLISTSRCATITGEAMPRPGNPLDTL
jgi:hypothetical protein